MTTKTITPELKLTALKHLAGGKSLEVTASIVGLPRETVLDLASNYGYPDRDKLAWAVDVLATKLDEQAKVLPERTPVRAPAPRPVAAAPSSPTLPPVVAVPKSELQTILDAAHQHPSKRIQRAADKVIDDIDRLRTMIREDEEKNSERRRLEQQRAAERARAEKEKAEARAEVERLEAQLAAAKAKLRGKAAATAAVKKKPAVTTGEHVCDHDGCDRTFDRIQALRMHQRRAHEGFNPNAAKAAS